MKSSRKAEIALAALLPLTVAIKVAAARPSVGVDRALFAAKAEALLDRQGYATGLDDRPSGIVVSAARDGCRMTLREYQPGGIYAVVIADQARNVGTLHYAYRGALYGEPPKLRPLAEYYGRRALQRFGVTLERAPIVAVAASEGCDVASLPWQRLATMSR